MIESGIVCRVNLFLSFVNLIMQEFYEFFCVVIQKRIIELEDNKDRLINVVSKSKIKKFIYYGNPKFLIRELI
jgi:hypothetical protein